MTDDHEEYCDYYPDYELTEQQALEIYISEDANPDYDSQSLMHRQQQRWEELDREVRNHAEHNLDRFEEALSSKERIRRPTWWKLWVPPPLGDQLLTTRQDDRRLIKQGELTLTVNNDYRDIYWANSVTPHRLLERVRIYLDFRPDARFRFPNIFPNLIFNEVITQDMMHGEWGWLEGETIRTPIQEARPTLDPENPEIGYTGLDILATCPPPYGVWLPAFHDMNIQENE